MRSNPRLRREIGLFFARLTNILTYLGVGYVQRCPTP